MSAAEELSLRMPNPDRREDSHAQWRMNAAVGIREETRVGESVKRGEAVEAHLSATLAGDSGEETIHLNWDCNGKTKQINDDAHSARAQRFVKSCA